MNISVRIWAYMVTKNEGDRYLREAIDSLRDQVDGLFVYDDQSTDDTVDILTELKVPHVIRASGRPSFLEHEGEFRQDAWGLMTSMFSPHMGDWIITLDADERLRTNLHLKEIAGQAEDRGQDGVWMKVQEMWADNKVRTDGFWGGITALRFCAFKPNGRFKTHRNDEAKTPIVMGAGSVPDYVERPGKTPFADILHFGYYNPDERPAKAQRYAKIPGHNPRHIRSILQTPVLANLPELV